MKSDAELDSVATALAIQTAKVQLTGGLTKTAGAGELAQNAKQLLSRVWHAAPSATGAINDPKYLKQVGLASLRNAALGAGAGGATGLLAAALHGRDRKSKWESMLHGGLLGASLGGLGTAGYYGANAASRDLTARFGEEGKDIARQSREEEVAQAASPGASVLQVGRGLAGELGSVITGVTPLPKAVSNTVRLIGGDTDGQQAGRITGLAAGAAAPSAGRLLANTIRNAWQPYAGYVSSAALKPYLTRGMARSTLATTAAGGLLGTWYDRYKAHQAAQAPQAGQ